MKSNYGFDRDFIFDIRQKMLNWLVERVLEQQLTVATIAELENRTIKKDAVITGTIESDVRSGKSGIIEKTKDVADAGHKRFLVPKG